VKTAYQRQQTPPQQRLLQGGSYQQQSYKAGGVGFAFFAFVFLSVFFIINAFPAQNKISH
jgi:hypothetical protein